MYCITSSINIGTLGAHRKTGCRVCGTESGCEVSTNKCECDYHSKQNQLAIVENNIRRKVKIIILADFNIIC